MDAYYKEQLRVLREETARFAQRNPALAPMLVKQGGDPDVERILEGTAYLCAKVHQRLDSLAPRMARDILRLVYPQHLLPLPSTAVICFKPLTNMGNSLNLPQGTQVASVPVDRMQLIYSTERDITILPLTIRNVTETHNAGVTDSVTVEIKSNSPLRRVMPTSLEFYLPGAYAQASQRMNALVRYVDHVEIETSGIVQSLPASCVGLSDMPITDMRLTKGKRANRNYLYVQRFFTAPEQLLFVTVRGIDTRNFRESDDQLRIRFCFKKVHEQLPAFDQESFALNAVSVINVFTAHAEPIRQDNTRERYTLRAQAQNGHKIEIIDVEHAETLRPGGQIEPCYTYDGWNQLKNGLIYTIVTEPSEHKEPDDKYFEPLYVLKDGKEEKIPDYSTISADLICCNYAVNHKLRVGDICKSTDNSPVQATFSNITVPSVMVPGLRNDEAYWSFLGAVASNLIMEFSVTAVRGILESYAPDRERAPDLHAAGLQRWSAIVGCTAHDEERLFKGRLFRGRSLILDMDPQGFISSGDMYLFAETIDRLCSDYIPINMYARLTISVQGKNEEIQWKPRFGGQPLN